MVVSHQKWNCRSSRRKPTQSQDLREPAPTVDFICALSRASFIYGPSRHRIRVRELMDSSARFSDGEVGAQGGRILASAKSPAPTHSSSCYIVFY